jgi:hypothetical protein
VTESGGLKLSSHSVTSSGSSVIQNVQLASLLHIRNAPTLIIGSGSVFHEYISGLSVSIGIYSKNRL